jgi:hypothetical protein
MTEKYPYLGPDYNGQMPGLDASLKAFAAAHGRSWKKAMREVYWYNARVWRDDAGAQHNILHALRNQTHGYKYLEKFNATTN